MVLIGFFSDLLQLPSWARDISPLEHLPAMPAEPLSAAPVIALTTLAALLAGAGLWGLERRDLQLH